MSKVSRALRLQFDRNEGKNLLHSGMETLLEIDETFLAALEEMVSIPEAPNSNLDGIAADAATSFVGKIYALNQYIQVSEAAKDILKGIYVASWNRMVETREVESTIRNHHYPLIRAFLETLYPRSIAAELQSTTRLGRVPSSEYSAELQTRVLRLDPNKLKEPILDIGCGTEGNLVRYLRAQKLKAFGIDRTIRNGTDYLIQADWFEYDYGINKWGTVVSNLSIANHLIYAQKYDEARVSEYLKTFTHVLDSLSEGGTFSFAPAVEQLVEYADCKRYKVDRWEISPRARGMGFTRIAS